MLSINLIGFKKTVRFFLPSDINYAIDNFNISYTALFCFLLVFKWLGINIL